MPKQNEEDALKAMQKDIKETLRVMLSTYNTLESFRQAMIL
jgi:hypothetical protein